MRCLSTILLVVFCVSYAMAQDQDIEKQIRGLEQMEVSAILSKDSATLLRLWDKDYTVNSPDNIVVSPVKTTLDRPVLRQARSSFVRDIEKIIVQGNTVVSMGSETVTPISDQATASRILKRRYTNIWMKPGSEWNLVARHANVICQSN